MRKIQDDHKTVLRSRPNANQADRNALGLSIEEYRKKAGMSRTDLAKRMDMTLGGVSAWEYGRTRPDIDSLKKLCSILNVSSDELLEIEGTFSHLKDDEKNLIASYRSLPKREKEYVRGFVGIMTEAQSSMDEPQIYAITDHVSDKAVRRMVKLPLNPLSICAGNGIFLEEEGEGEYLQLKYEPILSKCDEILRVSGDSMEPEYSDGDLVLVQHADMLNYGETGVFAVDGEGLIKKYQKDGLYPLNPKYSVIRPGSESHVRCFGRVLGKVKPEMLTGE